MEPVRRAGKVFFPLDQELRLTSSDLTPHAQEGLVRLASWVPFAKAAQLLEGLLGVQASPSQTRRATLQAGRRLCEHWEEQVGELEKHQPSAPAGAARQVFSADGAMVPLRAGIWAEVKTLAIGTVKEPAGGEEVHVQDLSYCSRLTDVAGFEQASLVEWHRRGGEQAEAVAAVMDGAEWLQGVIDYHRADAVRILDFPHAAEYVSAIGEAVRAAGFSLPKSWLDGVLHRLKQEGPERVLAHLARLCQRCGTPEVWKKWSYLQARHDQMQYPQYQAAGWPIGSGMVESANKGVVEARLKGTGMRWERVNVNPLLLLRNAVCNDQWKEYWQVARNQQQRDQQQLRLRKCRQRRQRLATQVQKQLVLMLLRCSHHPTPPEEPLSQTASTSSLSPASPKGRTDAQKNWGRRPFSRKGVLLAREFAKK